MGRNDAGRLNLAVFQNPLFLACALTYGLNIFCLKPAFSYWFFQHYLNDLVCMPLVLVVTIFMQRSFFNKPAYNLNKYQTGIAVAYFTLMFEVVIPLWNARYTADFWDVFCYGFGGWLFYRFGNSGKEILVSKIR
jgi:hypothetical protein